MQPLILDFDASVQPLPDATSIALQQWQEAIRFGCTLNTLAKLGSEIEPVLAAGSHTTFLGSGDYHHITHLLIRRYAKLGQPLQLVVFDNHPDNMRYPFGIHCGSWVNHVSRLPFLSCVHVLGITSPDVETAHAWENHLRPLRSGKVRYWCVGRDLGWTKYLGITGSRSYSSTSSMLDAFAAHIQTTTGPVYLSIDKDVLAADVVHTNWDQGVMRLEEMAAGIRLLRGRLVGSDVTGEVSVYRYRSRFKRILSGLDGQPEITEAELTRWQGEHQAINRQLLEWLP